jgi:AmiR/NasT family two-component response regulator
MGSIRSLGIDSAAIEALGSRSTDGNEAARRGVFACVAHDDPAELESAIEVVLHRFAEFRSLEGAFGRRAPIERAKGILMERHQVSEREAFKLLRSTARSSEPDA